MVRRERANVAPGLTMRGRVMLPVRSEGRADNRSSDFESLAVRPWRFRQGPPAGADSRNHDAIGHGLSRSGKRRWDGPGGVKNYVFPNIVAVRMFYVSAQSGAQPSRCRQERG